jgi:hypothetical protein
VASLATDIREKLHMEPLVEPGPVGQLDVFVDGELVSTQRGIAGLKDRLTCPDNDALIALMAERLARERSGRGT